MTMYKTLVVMVLINLYGCQEILKQKLYVGQSVKLKCGPIERYVNVAMTFRWEKPIGNVIGNEPVLSLQNVNFKDGGTYTCRATHTINDKTTENILSTELSINKRESESESVDPLGPLESPSIKFSEPNKDSIELPETGYLYAQCSVQNWLNNDYSARWLRFQKVSNDGNSNLFVFPLDTQRDGGTYTCQVYHKSFPEKKYERELKVQITKPNIVIKSLNGENLKIGGRIYRKCQVENGINAGYEKLTFSWMKDNSVTVSKTDTLDIPILDTKTNGKYTCIINSLKGEKSYNQVMDIIIDDAGSSEPGSYTINVFTQPMTPEFNKPFQLSCQVSPPIPNAQYQWIKDGKIVSNQQIFALPLFQKQDIGSYSCNVIDLALKKTISGRFPSSAINVAFMYSTENKIELSDKGSQMISRVGEKRELHCEIPANSNIKGESVQWFFNGRPFDELSRNYYNLHRLDAGFVSILSLLKISMLNEGQYVCEVGGVKKSANLIVLEEISSMEIYPEKLEKDPGESVEFHCRVNNIKGFINSQIRWSFRSKDGQRSFVIDKDPKWIKMNNPSTPETSFISTQRASPEDEGYYTCTTPAGNEKTAELIIRRKKDDLLLTITPDTLRVSVNQPITLECFSISSTSSQPSGTPKFSLEYGRNLNQDSRFLEINVGQSRKRLIIVNGLYASENGLKVECRVDDQVKTVVIHVQKECSSRERKCNNGDCVSSEKFCDNVRDCPDGSDELSSICTGGKASETLLLTLTPETVRVGINQPITVECSSISKYTRQPSGEPRFFLEYGRTLSQDPRLLEMNLGQSRKRLFISGGLSMSDNGMKVECRVGDLTKTLVIFLETECPSSYRRCNNGECIASGKFCDGVNDCQDGSDEVTSTCVAEKSSNNFILTITPEIVRVRTGQPIVVECFSISKESGQPSGDPTFFLQFGRQLNEDSRLSEMTIGQSRKRLTILGGLTMADNGMKVECRLGDLTKSAILYLENECPTNYRRCSNGNCLPSGKFCDGTQDCADGSDEISSICNMCDPISIQCEYNAGKSPGKKMFLVHWKCDGENDCGNNYDEAYCSEEDAKCGGMNFTCDSGKVIPRAYQCDKETDCEGGEDESGCVAPQIMKMTQEKIRRIRRGDSVKLFCESKSVPKSYILWRHNWGCLKDKSRMRISNSMNMCSSVISTLTIQNFQPGDDGIYNCEALSAQNRAFSEDYQLILENI